MFMGTYYNSIDAKNRMIVPSKHRDQLGGKCVITKGLDKCLYIYSLPDWEKQLEKIGNYLEKREEPVMEIQNSGFTHTPGNFLFFMTLLYCI